MASYFSLQMWFYKNVTELSGGQKQRLNLASIMAMQSSILVLNEPISQQARRRLGLSVHVGTDQPRAGNHHHPDGTSAGGFFHAARPSAYAGVEKASPLPTRQPSTQRKSGAAMKKTVREDLHLLDEPTKGLDTGFKRVFAEILQTLLCRGITVLMISHDIEFCPGTPTAGTYPRDCDSGGRDRRLRRGAATWTGAAGGRSSSARVLRGRKKCRSRTLP